MRVDVEELEGGREKEEGSSGVKVWKGVVVILLFVNGYSFLALV